MSRISRLLALLLVGAVVLVGCGKDGPPEPPIGQIRDMNEYLGASGTFQEIVNVDNDIPVVPNWVEGRHVLFLAQGSVDGAVDFSDLEKEDVDVDGKSVTIRLPHAELKDVQFNVEKSRILDQDRGLWTAFEDLLGKNPPDVRPFFAAAEPKLREDAKKSEILEKTEENTRKMLTGLFSAVGYETVKVDWQDSPA